MDSNEKIGITRFFDYDTDVKKYAEFIRATLNTEINPEEEFFKTVYGEILDYEGKHLEDYYKYLLMELMKNAESPRDDEEHLSRIKSLKNALLGIQNISEELKKKRNRHLIKFETLISVWKFREFILKKYANFELKIIIKYGKMQKIKRN